jgi:putative sigma-54 modulation protein
MRLELTGRHVRITTTLQRLVDERLKKLDRLLHDRAVSIQVVLSAEKSRPKAEMTLHARGDHFFHATGGGDNFEIALNLALSKINQQARKLKGKWEDGKRRGVSAVKAASAVAERGARGLPGSDGDGAGRPPRVVRVRSRAAKPMSVEDAAAELGDGTEAVIVFRNASTDTVNVLFRRPDGNLGLIEPEA